MCSFALKSSTANPSRPSVASRSAPLTPSSPTKPKWFKEPPMILDGLLCFTSLSGGGSGAGDSPTTGTQVSTNQIDLGVTSGVPTSANGGGARDIGIGDDPAMKILVQVTTAFLGGTSLGI